ncbi:MAG: hypothetical protein Q7S21_07020 [archaeon]|nr:hypothetical protein [archaeon]
MKTKVMHFLTIHELHKIHANQEWNIKRIIPEQEVILHKHHSLRKGKFDFLVETVDNKIIGFEVLTRPSAGKMKEKLAYANEVDEFVFVLPYNDLEFYQKPRQKVFHKQIRRSSFGKEFNSKKLSAWMLNIPSAHFVLKDKFNKIFNVEK